MKYGIHRILLFASCAFVLFACELPAEDVGESHDTQQGALDEHYESALDAEKERLNELSHADREARINELQEEFQIERSDMEPGALAQAPPVAHHAEQSPASDARDDGSIHLANKLTDAQLQRRQQYREAAERAVVDVENPTDAEIRELERLKAEIVGEEEPMAPTHVQNLK